MTNGRTPDLGKDNAVMLAVKSGKSSYDKYLIKNFKSYKGPYEIVSAEDLKSDKFADKEKFKYVFEYTFESVRSQDNQSSFNVRRFSVYDRKNDKKYVPKVTSSFFSKVMQEYIKNLNTRFQSNQ